MYYHTATVHDIVIRWHIIAHTSHIHVCVMELYP